MTEVVEEKEVIEVQEDTQVDEKKWCVYMHTNKINGKRYIGITSKVPKYRWKSNGKGYYKQPRIWKAIQKYGWENFKHEILLQNETFDYACKVEKCLIKHYKTRNEKYGYNLTDGGEGTYGIQKFGKDNPNYGNHKLAGENNPSYKKYYRFKPVYAIELDKMFFSSREAERHTGADHSSIIKCCKNKIQKTCGRHPVTGVPLQWKYVYDQEQKDGTIIQGAITLGYITRNQADEYLNNLKQKGND